MTGLVAMIDKERTQLSERLAKKLAQAVCGHLACSWPDCGCKSTKRKINAVAFVVSESIVQSRIVGFDAAPE